MCLTLGSSLHIKNIIVKSEKGEEGNSAEWRAYNCLTYAIRETKKNSFRSRESVNIINKRLMAFWKEINQITIKGISEN